MKKLGSVGLRWLKISHLVLVAIFFGGIISSLVLNLKLSLSNYDEVYLTYKSLSIISDNLIRYAAQGTLLIGGIYGVFTNWGFIKHRWIAVKWILFILQTVIGILFVDKLLVANLEILETQKSMALQNPVFLANHFLRQDIVIVQVLLTIFILGVSVIKPWKRKNKIRTTERNPLSY